MDVRYQLFIDGKYCDASDGRTFDIVCPGNNEILAQVPRATPEDENRAVESAARAFEDKTWRFMEVKTRVDLLRRVSKMLLDRQDEWAQTEALDTGNPIKDVKEYYLPGSIGCFDFFPSAAYHLAGQQIPISAQRLDYTVYEPVGPVAIVVPWNDPLEIASGRLATALAVGNTCVLKPSPLAPLTCLRLGELFLEAGLPPGVVNIISGMDDEIATPLINHPLIRMISFTGSVATGQVIQEAAAKTTKRLSLEMGGKSANIVFGDADLSKAVPGAAQAIFWMSGQNCVAGSRLFVHESIYDKFLEDFKTEASRYRLGHVLDPKTVLGPLISKKQLAKVKNYVESAQADGATAIVAGSLPEDPDLQLGNYHCPTILAGVQPWMRAAREEIFGPVVCLSRFSTTEEVLRIANATHYGLGSGVWTENLSLAHRVASELAAGTVYVNTYNEFYNQVPFGGYKQSGLGFEYGLDALRQYVDRKNVLIRLN